MKVTTIVKQFNDCVREINEIEKELKVIPQTLPIGEVGKGIKIYTFDYYEIIAEIRKLMIIKKIKEKAGKR